ncbi:hypothetical protein R2Q26_15015 [Nitrosomonas sp. Is37]|nr:hypothetical protein [Nitrosomonas sp. Is37]MDV6345833.1 hypothetical protein [Nitrosomonas sp. Is37]
MAKFINLQTEFLYILAAEVLCLTEETSVISSYDIVSQVRLILLEVAEPALAPQD